MDMDGGLVILKEEEGVAADVRVWLPKLVKLPKPVDKIGLVAGSKELEASSATPLSRSLKTS